MPCPVCEAPAGAECAPVNAAERRHARGGWVCPHGPRCAAWEQLAAAVADLDEPAEAFAWDRLPFAEKLAAHGVKPAGTRAQEAGRRAAATRRTQAARRSPQLGLFGEAA
jgi:hypothetical protein